VKFILHVRSGEREAQQSGPRRAGDKRTADEWWVVKVRNFSAVRTCNNAGFRYNVVAFDLLNFVVGRGTTL
jgi:hypothetical protein